MSKKDMGTLTDAGTLKDAVWLRELAGDLAGVESVGQFQEKVRVLAPEYRALVLILASIPVPCCLATFPQVPPASTALAAG